jgi:hypothetical protein
VLHSFTGSGATIGYQNTQGTQQGVKSASPEGHVELSGKMGSHGGPQHGAHSINMMDVIVTVNRGIGTMTRLDMTPIILPR